MSRKNRLHPEFERDYKFYFDNRQHFTFAGSDIKRLVQYPGESEPTELDDEGNIVSIPFAFPYSEQGKTAKDCFYKADSEGKRVPCSEPHLLVELLTCKAGVNLQIKQWAEGRADCTLCLVELQEYTEHYQCPEWVLKAVENQKLKIIKEWIQKRRWEEPGLYYESLEQYWVECIQEIAAKDSQKNL